MKCNASAIVHQHYQIRRLTIMYTLYYSPATASMVVHLMLIELNVPHELRLTDIEKGAQHDPEYRRLNPNGHVPTIVVDGKPMYEAAAITMFLADRHADAKFAPSIDDPKRTVYLQWFFHFANSLQPAYRLWFYQKDLPGTDHEVVKKTVAARIEGVWERVDAHLAANDSPFMLGNDVSALDLYMTMLMRWSRSMPKPATTWPRLAALADRIKARPAWKKLYEVEGLTDWA
ncbi:Aste57867_23969 [Aphanomyces stellatus]|uniref:Aste57867_23969 protein n=1 Tax=Aphanomyces stellatus TaxID=120398 RepID=A0A485LTI7_9STRA|nr:hypothetical protein As57867_023896 [Aphanomyces stellatus]VFU00612.1 Aste57867_23969 [Aphanomyces stellatus]